MRVFPFQIPEPNPNLLLVATLPLCGTIHPLTILKMKPLRFLAPAVLFSLLSLTLVSSHAQATNTNSTTILGQWDFDISTNLAKATIGADLQFLSFSPTFQSSQIGTQFYGTVSIPAFNTAAERILATFAPTNNGTGTNLNQYTIIMDLMWPAESAGLWRALFNASTNNSNDAELFVERDGQIGIFNDYAGFMIPETWYRLVTVFDLATNQMTRYLDGTNSAGAIGGPSTLPLPEGRVDGQFSLNDAILFFSDNDGETAPVFVNVIQLRAGAMTPEEVAALGGPAAGNLGTGTVAPPIPPGDITIESITREGANIHIRVDNDGRNIRLQRSTDIANPNSWIPILGPQTSPDFTVANDSPSAFFRVVSP